MFTGIITATGTVREVNSSKGDISVMIDAPELDRTDLDVGASISVNGVCLTLIELTGTCFRLDISSETLARTTFAELSQGSRVNLERAMKLGDRLDGHMLTGHVDATGTIRSITPEARSRRYVIEIPAGLHRYVCSKGSIGIDGVSLTVNNVAGNTIAVNIIPHTLERTIIADYRAGTRVNLEVDIIARYLEGLLQKPDGDKA
jgi:riboflavin synthase